MGLGKHIRQFRCQPCHFLFKRLAVIFLLFNADIAPEELEKVAREKYLMKKENEDIYIFEEDLKKNKDE